MGDSIYALTSSAVNRSPSLRVGGAWRYPPYDTDTLITSLVSIPQAAHSCGSCTVHGQRAWHIPRDRTGAGTPGRHCQPPQLAALQGQPLAPNRYETSPRPPPPAHFFFLPPPPPRHRARPQLINIAHSYGDRHHIRGGLLPNKRRHLHPARPIRFYRPRRVSRLRRAQEHQPVQGTPRDRSAREKSARYRGRPFALLFCASG